MNLLIHDLAVAIERDANDAPCNLADMGADGRAAMFAGWQLRFEVENIETRRYVRTLGHSSKLDDTRSAQLLPGVTR